MLKLMRETLQMLTDRGLTDVSAEMRLAPGGELTVHILGTKEGERYGHLLFVGDHTNDVKAAMTLRAEAERFGDPSAYGEI
jgi:hypothetical protein